MPKKTKDKLKERIGIIRITQKGIGFLRNGEKYPTEIPPGFLSTALNGDTVRVVITSKRKQGGEFGEVVQIVKRAKIGFSGVLIKEGGELMLEARDPRMPFNILIPKENKGDGKPGDKVFVTIKKWKSRKKPPIGMVEKVLGPEGDHNAEMEGIILEKGFQSDFPKNVEAEANKIKDRGIDKKELEKRRDMRDTDTFTIDPYDAKDFDDALSFKKINENRFEVGIHIADVSHYVTPGSNIDKEALERATSVYLVDRTIPMLPETLSNDLCSLNPNEDKLTFSAIFEIDLEGKVHKEWFGRTIINSNKRFTYEEAQDILNNGSGLFFDELNTLNIIAKKLTEDRIAAGAILIEQDEVKFKLDENGKPIDVFTKKRQDTNKLIEEFMLLANRRVAKFGGIGKDKKERVFVYRVHEDPDKEKMKELIAFIKLLGYEVVSHKGFVPPKEFNKLFEQMEGKSEKDTVQSMVVRSMQKALYSTKNTTGHYGLAFDYYTHFTSPIRRYPDIMVHRILDKYLKGEVIGKEKRSYYEKKAEHSSERERDAQEAERTSIKYKQVEYMADRIGQKFTGIVTGITEWGVYVAEEKSRAEGMIKLRDLEDDYFTYDEKNMTVSGEKTKKVIRIGDKLNIKVKRADIEEQAIDYIFA